MRFFYSIYSNLIEWRAFIQKKRKLYILLLGNMRMEEQLVNQWNTLL